MKPKQIIKIFVDVMMTGLFIVLMAYHITGNAVHEWLGISLFVLFILHHILNIGWYKTVLRGRYSPMRTFMLVLNCLLFIAMLGMMVSGIMLSREVFGFLHLRAGMFGRRLHMVSTAWGYLLMSMHLGMHWGMVVGMVHRRGLRCLCTDHTAACGADVPADGICVFRLWRTCRPFLRRLPVYSDPVCGRELLCLRSAEKSKTEKEQIV